VLTFTLSGVSKISALPQMKVAWVATSGPAEQVEAAQARLEMISDSVSIHERAYPSGRFRFAGTAGKPIQRQLVDRVRGNLAANLTASSWRATTCQRLSVKADGSAFCASAVTADR